MEDKSTNLINDVLFDVMIRSVNSYEDIIVLFDKINNPELLKRRQKQRLFMKLIKFSQSYSEILKVRDFYVEILQYPLTDKQVWRIIEKLVWASTNNQQLREVKDYAKSKGFISRYMKVLFSKHVADYMRSIGQKDE